LVYPNALGAQNTLGEIPFDKWIDLLNSAPLGDSLKFYQPDAHVGSYFSQLTAVAFITHQAGIRVAGQHELDNRFPTLNYPW
jgi:hypothetical protein